MRATVSRDLLAPALSKASGLVASRTPLPILSACKLEFDAGGLSITTCDMCAWYTTRVDADGETWSGCVDAARMTAFATSIQPGSDITFSAGDSRLTVRSSGATLRLAWLPPEDYPTVAATLTDPTATSLEIDPVVLSDALRFVEPAAAEDGARGYLIGVYLDPQGLLVGCDGCRMHVARLAATLPPIPDNVILPLPIVRLLPSLLRGFSSDIAMARASSRSPPRPTWPRAPRH